MAYPVFHFEVLAKDAPAMQRFYHDAFGWRIGPQAKPGRSRLPWPKVSRLNDDEMKRSFDD